MHKSSLVLALLALVAANSGALAAPLPLDLVTALQPLQPRTEGAARWPAPLRAIAVQAAKGHHAQACRASEALRADLMHKAAALFFAPERKNADVPAIERFLEQWVRGPAPLLEVPTETFTPVAQWRALAVDSCVRASMPDVALTFLAQAGSHGGDSTSRTALAVVLAQRAADWSAALAVLAGTEPSLRVLLLRALAGTSPRGEPWLAQARAQARAPSDMGLVDAVAVVLAARGSP